MITSDFGMIVNDSIDRPINTPMTEDVYYWNASETTKKVRRK